MEERSFGGKVLVTGAAGFIGARLSERLLDRGDDVIGIDNLLTGTTDAGFAFRFVRFFLFYFHESERDVRLAPGEHIELAGHRFTLNASFADIDRAGQAVRYAKQPRIHTFISTSPVHMKHKLQMEPHQVLEAVVGSVTRARNHVDDVEWSAEDATRTEFDFLCRCVEAAIKAGAKGLMLKDVSLQDLTAAIRALAEDRTAYQPAMTESLMAAIRRSPVAPTDAAAEEALAMRAALLALAIWAVDWVAAALGAVAMVADRPGREPTTSP